MTLPSSTLAMGSGTFNLRLRGTEPMEHQLGTFFREPKLRGTRSHWFCGKHVCTQNLHHHASSWLPMANPFSLVCSTPLRGLQTLCPRQQQGGRDPPCLDPIAARASVYTASHMAPALRVPYIHRSSLATMSLPITVSGGGQFDVQAASWYAMRISLTDINKAQCEWLCPFGSAYDHSENRLVLLSR